MTDGSFDTNPSSEPYTNQYLQIVKDSNLSNCFFKFLFNVEEDNKAQKEETTKRNETPPQRASSKKTKEFTCSYDNCSKAYRSKENLMLHIQNVHMKQKPYKCSYCSMQFSHRNGRIYHERKVHTLEFPYKCQYEECGHVFPCKSAMMAHIRSAHLHIKRKKYNKKNIRTD